MQFINLLICKSLILILLLRQHSEGKLFTIKIHGNNPVCQVDERFLSIAVGTFQARQRFKALDFSSLKLKNIVSSLRPAYLRLGGSDANFLVFRSGPKRVQPTQPTISSTQTTTTETTTVTAATVTTSTPRTTIEETTKSSTTTKKPATTTEKSTTPEPTTKTTTEKSTTTEKAFTTPSQTNEVRTTEGKPATQAPTPPPTPAPTPPPTPALTLPGTTPSQMQLPNINVPGTSSPSDAAPGNPWGTKNSEMEKSDSETDNEGQNNKNENEKGSKDYVEDLKDSLELSSSNSDASQSQIVPAVTGQPAESQQVDSSYAEPMNNGYAERKVEHSEEQAPSLTTQAASYRSTDYQGNANETTVLNQSEQDVNQLQINSIKSDQDDASTVNQATDTSQEPTVTATEDQVNGAATSSSGFYGSTAKRNQMLMAKKRSKHQKYPFWLMADDFDRFAKFVQNTGLDMIFDINAFFRRSDGSWDATNAMDLLHHVEEKEFKIFWEFGNEPNRYRKYGKSQEISALQEGLDMIRMRSLLMRNKAYNPKLIGPGISRPGIAGSEKYLEDFLNIASWAIDAVTWHQYYVSKNAKLDEFTDPDTLDLFRRQITKINKVLAKSKTKKPVWLGETGSAWGGGAPGISDTFAASFMFLDKLGLAGLYCNQVVIRQSLLGGSYALLDDDFTPRPDYWVALLHKKLVGRKVFAINGGSKYVRIYAHCSRARAGYPKGAVTVIAINLKKEKVKIEFKDFKKQQIDQYLVTPSNNKLKSKNVELNGEELSLVSGMYVPKLRPVQTKAPVDLPPMTFAFYVIPFANMRTCM